MANGARPRDGRDRHRRDDAAGDDARRHGGRGASARTSATRRWSASSVKLPLVGRLIPIVADEYSDPEKGTGAVKITPAHDFNDFEVGKRHDLPLVNVLDAEARMLLKPTRRFSTASRRDRRGARAALHGVDRFEARKRVVAMMEAAGLLDKIEPHTHMVPHGDRSNVSIEPWLTDQWYVDAKTLAQPALAAVRAGKTAFVPEELGKDLFRLAGEHPAVVRVAPAVVGPPDSGVVWAGRRLCRGARRGRGAAEGRGEVGRRRRADARRGRARHLVLLGAVAVLDARLAGEDARAFKRFYPDHVLVTGFDIIFFWVARMMMMGLFMHEGGSLPRRLHPRARARREGRRRCRRPRATSSIRSPDRRIRRRRAALHAGGHGGAGRDIKLATRASRAIATFAPSSGTPRASPR
jgi:valyl-tRNA synthetase